MVVTDIHQTWQSLLIEHEQLAHFLDSHFFEGQYQTKGREEAACIHAAHVDIIAKAFDCPARQCLLVLQLFHPFDITDRAHNVPFDFPLSHCCWWKFRLHV